MTTQALVNIGFESAGTWRVVGDGLVAGLSRHAEDRNVLYAFVVDREVKYVGQTVQPLRVRMRGYERPVRGQSTNLSNHDCIRESLNAGMSVDILALPDAGELRRGDFHINIAAGLEADLIRRLQPVWNRGSRRKVCASDAMAATNVAQTVATTTTMFEVVLGTTYIAQGMFNAPKRYGSLFGADHDAISVFIEDESAPRVGLIDRRVNGKTGNPRIRRVLGLGRWFRSHAKVGDRLLVEVISRHEIRLRISGKLRSLPLKRRYPSIAPSRETLTEP